MLRYVLRAALVFAVLSGVDNAIMFYLGRNTAVSWWAGLAIAFVVALLWESTPLRKFRPL